MSVGNVSLVVWSDTVSLTGKSIASCAPVMPLREITISEQYLPIKCYIDEIGQLDRHACLQRADDNINHALCC